MTEAPALPFPGATREIDGADVAVGHVLVLGGDRLFVERIGPVSEATIRIAGPGARAAYWGTSGMTVIPGSPVTVLADLAAP